MLKTAIWNTPNTQAGEKSAATVSSSSLSGLDEGVRRELSQRFRAYELLEADPAGINRRVRSGGPLVIASAERTFEINLVENDLRASNYRAQVIEADGSVRVIDPGPIRTFRGDVGGARGTEARFTVDEQTFEGIIITPEALYYIEPLKNQAESAGGGQFLLYKGSDVVADETPNCELTLSEQVDAAAAGVAPRVNSSLEAAGAPNVAAALPTQTMGVIELATETSATFYNRSGSALGAVNNILTVMNQVDGVYRTQLGLTFKIVFQNVQTSDAATGYSIGTADEILNKFAAYWNANFGHINRDVTHMWSGFALPYANSEGYVLGIAHTGVVCNRPDRAYGISGIGGASSPLISALTTAHEMGHNFGAEHAGLGCGDTIMSPRGGGLTFCQFSKDQIRYHVNSNSGCLTFEEGCTTQVTVNFGTLNGTLSTSDCTDGWYRDEYLLSGTAGQQITISMTSPDFDTYLMLETPLRTQLWEDNNGAGGTDARIPSGGGLLTLPVSGQYKIHATSNFQGKTGSYKLTISNTAPACTYSISPLADTLPGAGMTGSFAVGGGPGCGWTAAVATGGDWLSLSSGQSGTGNGTVSYSAGEYTGTTPRTATIKVTGTNFTATHTVTQNSRAIITCATSAIGYGQTRSGTLAQGDCRVGAGDRYADYYAFSGTAGQRVAVSATGSFDTLLGLINRSAPGQPYADDDNGGGGTNSRMPAGSGFLTLPVTGEYIIVMTGPGGATGSYQLSLSLDSAAAPSPVRWDSNFNSDFFVRQHYRDFLGREADASGLGFWVNEIESCGQNAACRDVKRINVSAAFFLSIEFQQTGYLVYRMYKAAYGDAIEESTGLVVPVIRRSEFVTDMPLISQGVLVNVGDWQTQLENNKRSYAQAFVQRPRFIDIYGGLSATQFVDRLNENAGGVLTAADRTSLINEASAGTAAARASVLRKLAEHPELDRREKNRAFVLMEYYGYLRRNPNDAPEASLNYAGWNFWLGKLNQFGGDFQQAEMVKAYLLSDEYIKRFGQ